ncbi:MAG: proline--tRNA ligase anticodon binding domain-containing protein, partial [Candidatus Bathyarchaeia archaeon]
DVDKESILRKSTEILEDLRKTGISAVLDDRPEYTPGWKFNDWELKGVPIRIEIGPKEIKQKQVTLARRDTFERLVVKEEEIVDAVTKLLEEIQSNLFNRAKEALEEHITTVKTYDEFKETLRKRGGFIRACWCSSLTCEEKIKEETGATIRLIPLEKEELFSNCIYCGGKGKRVVYFGRAY